MEAEGNRLPGATYGQVKREKVLNSWKRSMGYGVDPYAPPKHLLVSCKELERIQNKNRDIIAVALPQMEALLAELETHEPCVVLTNPEGVLMARLNVEGHPVFSDDPGYALGSNWSERVSGTNAIGLTLAENEACFLSSNEHFLQDGGKWTCFASPVFNRHGQVIAALGLVYGYIRSTTADAMAKVINCARAIEMQCLKKLHAGETQLEDFIGKLTDNFFDAAVLVDGDGIVRYINKIACDCLGTTPMGGVGRRLEELVPKDNNRFWAFAGKRKKATGHSLPLVFNLPGKKKIRILANFLPLSELYAELFSPQENYRGEDMLITFISTVEAPQALVPGKHSGVARTHPGDLIGASAGLREAVRQAEMLAKSNANIVILGESGVGKDLLAQCIHNTSARAGGPYYAINCAAIPGDLLASELFGYEDGAFTGARRGGNPGKLELAHGGTLLLDEIGEMPQNLQVYLLRAIETKEIMRVGGRSVTLTDTRIISATNKNLEKAVADGTFRHDLYYRLATTFIHLPPLRQRKDDIPLLAEHYLRTVSVSLGRNIRRFSPAFMERLLAYDWPGNIRELKNTVERAAILCTGHVLEEDMLPPAFFSAAAVQQNPEKTLTRNELERNILADYLNRFRYNKSKTADAMGISRSSLYRKMKQYNL